MHEMIHLIIHCDQDPPGLLPLEVFLYVQLGGDLRVDPGLTGEILFPIPSEVCRPHHPHWAHLWWG